MPIIRETALQIADPQIRYQGTIGGNVANGDPGNDMPALMQCLDVPGTVRASFALYNSHEDVDLFIAALRKAITFI